MAPHGSGSSALICHCPGCCCRHRQHCPLRQSPRHHCCCRHHHCFQHYHYGYRGFHFHRSRRCRCCSRHCCCSHHRCSHRSCFQHRCSRSRSRRCPSPSADVHEESEASMPQSS